MKCDFWHKVFADYASDIGDVRADGNTAGVTGGDLTINDSAVTTTDVLNLSNANTAAQQAFGGAASSLFLNGYETVNLATGVSASGNQLINAINLQGDAAAATVLNISGANSLGTVAFPTGAITAGSINASGLTGTAATGNSGSAFSALKFTSTTSNSVSDALGTGTITMANFGSADEGFLSTYYDSLNSRAVIGVFRDTDTTIVNTFIASEFQAVGYVGMTSTEYTVFNASNFYLF